MKKLLVPVVAIALLASCNQHHEIKVPFTSAIVGLAMPVTLNPDTTVILTNDFFVEEKGVDSVKAEKGLAATLSPDKKKVWVIASATTPLISILTYYAGGYSYSVPLRRSLKVPVTITFDPKGKQYEKVQMVGHMNGWKPDKANFTLENNKWVYHLSLGKGSYPYQLVVDGNWILDPANHDSIDNNKGGFNSVLKVGNDKDDSMPHLFTRDFNNYSVKVGFRNKPDSVFAVWENYRVFVKMNDKSIDIDIPEQAKDMDRSHIRAWAYNKNGISNDVLIPLDKGKVVTNANELTRYDKERNILYFMMVDRFKDGDTTNDHPLNDPRVSPKADYQGGDLAGITQKIKEGYYTNLGTTCIWISPITQNPLVAYQEYPEPRRWFSGYHGYWPVYETKIDSRFGTDKDLDSLVAEAHSRNINVILDFVSNHVHEENPMYKNHPEYFNPLMLPDGRLNIRLWDEYRLTTWFDTFMPDINYDKPEVVNIMTDSATYWIKRFHLDGFRHDATKHVPEVFWEALTKKLKEQVIIPEKRPLFQIGETFGSRELIGSYISSGMEDAQFDFNLYFDARTVLAQDKTSFDILKNSLFSSFDFYGWHSLMGNITGNHDITRFISLASGAMTFGENDKEAGWSRDIEVKDPVGYNRLKMLEAFIMTIPGVPVIYAGDDIGDPGANDPDNRRMMRFTNLKPEEQSVKDNLAKLSKMRASSMPLLYGDFRLLQSSDSTFVYARTYFDKVDIVAFNKSRNPTSVTFDIPERYADDKLKTNFGNSMEQKDKTITLKLAGSSFEIVD